jgi:hypothetical protein
MLNSAEFGVCQQVERFNRGPWALAMCQGLFIGQNGFLFCEKIKIMMKKKLGHQKKSLIV